MSRARPCAVCARSSRFAGTGALAVGCAFVAASCGLQAWLVAASGVSERGSGGGARVRERKRAGCTTWRGECVCAIVRVRARACATGGSRSSWSFSESPCTWACAERCRASCPHHKTCNMQHRIDDVQHATDRIDDGQHAAHPVQYTACGVQRVPCRVRALSGATRPREVNGCAVVWIKYAAQSAQGRPTCGGARACCAPNVTPHHCDVRRTARN